MPWSALALEIVLGNLNNVLMDEAIGDAHIFRIDVEMFRRLQ